MDIIGLAKDAYTIAKRLNQTELFEKIVELREEAFKLSEENLVLKRENRALKEAEETRSKIKRVGNVYEWIETDPNNPGPFCMPCWDHDKKLINLIYLKVFRYEREETQLTCRICECKLTKTS